MKSHRPPKLQDGQTFNYKGIEYVAREQKQFQCQGCEMHDKHSKYGIYCEEAPDCEGLIFKETKQ